MRLCQISSRLGAAGAAACQLCNRVLSRYALPTPPLCPSLTPLARQWFPAIHRASSTASHCALLPAKTIMRALHAELLLSVLGIAAGAPRLFSALLPTPHWRRRHVVAQLRRHGPPCPDVSKRVLACLHPLPPYTAGELISTASYSCDPATCQPPECLCPSNTPPGGLTPSQIPQFVLVRLLPCTITEGRETRVGWGSGEETAECSARPLPPHPPNHPTPPTHPFPAAIS